MSLEGLRAWIGEVERKLGKRTRVFLVLTVIAIGLGGAAIYLAIDARESSVSESDVQALQEDLEARIAAGGSGAPSTQAAQLEVELRALQAEVAELKSAGGKTQSGKGKGGEAGGASSGGAAVTPPSDGATERCDRGRPERRRAAETGRTSRTGSEVGRIGIVPIGTIMRVVVPSLRYIRRNPPRA
jgi:hypothetical protein